MDVATLLLAGDWSSDAFAEAVDAAGPGDVEAVLGLHAHQDAEVRGAVVLTLPLMTHGGPPSPDMVRVTLALTTDPDRNVRDLACFALAEQWRDVDSPEIRDALAARLDDIDNGARCEALLGLAYRRDPRALPRAYRALSRPSGVVRMLELVAAGALSDPELHALVLRHQEGWSDPDDALVADVVRRLTDPGGVGGDVFDGVADLYRRRAHGRPTGDAVGAWRLMDSMLDVAPWRADEFLAEVLGRLEGDARAVREVCTRSALAVLADQGRSEKVTEP